MVLLMVLSTPCDADTNAVASQDTNTIANGIMGIPMLMSMTSYDKKAMLHLISIVLMEGIQRCD